MPGKAYFDAVDVPVETNLVLVDAVSGSDEGGGIGNSVPFQTIQAAVDAIVTANAVAPLGRKGYILRLGAWQTFDEDVTIDVSNALHLIIITNGNGLGTFANANWAPSGTARSLIFTGRPAAVDGIRPGVFIQSDAWAAWKPTTNEAFAGLRISGDIDGTAMTAGNLEFAFEGEVTGNVDFGATSIASTYWRQARLKGTLSGTNLLIFRARYSRFQGLITASQYSHFAFCRIQGGVTIAGLAGVDPQGFFGCEMEAGNYDTGGAGTLWMDLASNTRFVANGAVLTGGTTKTLLNDATP